MQRDIEGLWDSRLSAAPTETPFQPRRSRPHDRTSSAPNIVFLLADDLGWGDLGCFGSLHIKTPNLDRLAAQGLRMTHAYSASPWCSPMRIALYTGRNPGRLPAGLQEPLTRRDEHSGIPAEHPTLASILGSVGYRRAMFGKWHCGWLPWFSPLRSGFETFFGNLDGAMDYFCHRDTIGQKDLYEGETPVELESYYTWLIADRAASYVREQSADIPFYLQVNWSAPHWPWEGPGDADMGAEMERRLLADPRSSPLRHADGGSITKYAELVEAMDDGIGRILAALEETGQADNTIVVFCSDNGGERYSFQWPFIGEKGDITEGGIRVPFIVRWPDVIDPGQWTDQLCQTMDWTATLINAAGAQPDPAYPLDGVSLLPWLTGQQPHPAHSLFFRTSSQGALRHGRYKYVIDHRPFAYLGNWPLNPGPREQLFDIAGDGREAADLATTHPGLVAELRAEWQAINATLLPYPAEHRGLAENVQARLGASVRQSWPD